MQDAVTIGWIMLVVGAVTTWWAVLSRSIVQSRRPPAALLGGLVLSLLGHWMIETNQVLAPTNHTQAATFFALIVPVVVLKLAARGRQRPVAGPAAPVAAATPAPTPPTVPPGSDEVLAANLNVRLAMAYRDAKGATSQRTVIVHRVDGRRDREGRPIATRLHAYCLAAKATRDFRVDRIQECSDPSTGEIIPDVGSHLLNNGQDMHGTAH